MPIKSKKTQRAPMSMVASRLFRDAIDGGHLTSAELARAFRMPQRTVQAMVSRARAETTADTSAELSAGDRRHLGRAYGRSKDPAVQEWLRQQNRRSGR